jgi:hypothetical protein
MLQPFVLNVSSVFSDVRCKCVYLNVAYVSHKYCKCSIWMLYMFYNDFSSVSSSSASVSDACSSVLSISRYMLQMFHLDVLKVDRVLHPLLAFCCLALVSPLPTGADWASAAPSPLFTMLQMFHRFQMHVLCVSSGCCNDYTSMFQEYTAYVAMVGWML